MIQIVETTFKKCGKIIAQRSSHLEESFMYGIPYMRFFSVYGVEVHYCHKFILYICKNERIKFNGAKFKMKIDSKEDSTERYPGGVYQVYDQNFRGKGQGW